ncbi:outer membrane beta-barrel protein [Hymenobacter busanensis]|uniref:Outer membrane beta-barrel protein n=1 Tax=Hymenobacter busanensis TaxID=2607656 RepID=A0A7L5A2L9_9BACT|nr:DUF6089 family protein [Hymenobacter busanensis]KAA9331538.1 outer membrane beta-barrel protein [Hymenobacter busanensis]QHJ08692.1 hypothetical protein GUY19_15905 [Hymenobacter busanensis]
MKKFLTLTLSLVLALVLVSSQASAQQFSKRKQYNSVGVSLNAMNYFGDITPKPSIASFRFAATRPNIGFSFTHRFAPRISVRAGLAYGRITGDDAKAADDTDPDAKYRFNRNMNFRNDIVEGSLVGVFDLIENRNNYLKRPDFVPYIFAGIAGFHHNPKGLVGNDGPTDIQGDYIALQPLGTEGQRLTGDQYGLWQFSIPFGGGVRYKLNKSFDLGLEIGWRKTFTDYIDDVSTNYVNNPADLSAGAARYFGYDITKGLDGTYSEANQAGGQRGKSNEDDWYIVTGLSVNYILAPRVKSPKFR